MPRRRIDTLLAERGLARSRSSAAESVRAGRVRVGRDGPIATKPAELVAEDAELLVDEGPRHVSRGGIKLENALEALGVDVEGLDCIDVGASTGGFTDCLLQRGAARVVALDVGYGQLDWKLRNDDRVVVMERANARELGSVELPFVPALATIDVSFISLAKVLGAAASALREDGGVLALVKPQFELGRERVGSGGVVRDASDRREALVGAAHAAERAGLTILGFASSGLPGPKGNRETFLWASRGSGAGIDVERAAAVAEPDYGEGS
jgi:23S rRNA (cytidine1920-2'-O)/16S rRNA (cytidine1409-2'-O)-methyltransferase